MDVPDIVIASILSISVILSLILGIKALRQTKNIEQTKISINALNDIINWATEIKQCGMGKEMTDMARLKDPEEERKYILARASETQVSFTKEKDKIAQMLKLVKAFNFGEALEKAIENMDKVLYEHIDCFRRYRGALLHKPGSSEHFAARDAVSLEILEHKTVVNKSADTIIEELVNSEISLLS